MQRTLFLILIFSFTAASGLYGATVYIVGVEDLDYYPYYSNRNGDYSGFSRELLDAFAAAANISFEYRPLPVKRLFASLLAKDVDFKFPDNPKWQTEMKKGVAVSYSEPLAISRDGIMVRPERKGAGLEKLRVLGTMRGFTPWIYLEYIEGQQIELTENDAYAGLLRQVLVGRIDGAYVNPVVARVELEKIGKAGELVFDPGLSYQDSEYLLSTIKHPEVVREFNAFLKKNPDVVKALKEKYGL